MSNWSRSNQSNQVISYRIITHEHSKAEQSRHRPYLNLLLACLTLHRWSSQEPSSMRHHWESLSNNRRNEHQQPWWDLIWKDCRKCNNKISWTKIRVKTSMKINKEYLQKGCQSKNKRILLQIKLVRRKALFFNRKSWGLRWQNHRLLEMEGNRLENANRQWVQVKEEAWYRPNKIAITNQQHLRQMPLPKGSH